MRFPAAAAMPSTSGLLGLSAMSMLTPCVTTSTPYLRPEPSHRRDQLSCWGSCPSLGTVSTLVGEVVASWARWSGRVSALNFTSVCAMLLTASCPPGQLMERRASGSSRPATGTTWWNLSAHRLPQLIPDEVLHDPHWGAPITPVDAVDREDPQARDTLG